MRDRLRGGMARLLLLPLAGLVFAGALGAGFQWGGPSGSDVVRVFEGEAAERIGSDGAPVGDLAGFVTEGSATSWTLRVGDDQRTVQFDGGSVVEALLPVTAEAAAVGDYVVIGGTDDNVNSFITTGIVIVPAAAAQTGEDAAAAIAADAEQN